MISAALALEASPQTFSEIPPFEETSLRDFVDTVAQPTDQEWRDAYQRLTVIGHEIPVIALCNKLIRAEAHEVLLHQQQVTLTADVMGQRDGLSTEHLEQLNRAGQVHDVGKADPLILKWTRSSERYQGERLKAFMGVIARHSDLGVEMIYADVNPYLGKKDVDGVGTYVWGWDVSETEANASLVWGHHTFKANSEQRYGKQPAETDPLFPAALNLAIADMTCAMAEGNTTRAYKDAFPRDVIRSELHSGSSVDNTRIDHLLYGDLQPEEAQSDALPNCEPARRRHATNLGWGTLRRQKVRLVVAE